MNKYVKILALSIRHTLTHYQGLIGRAIFVLACMIVFLNLWQVLGVSWSVRELLWYIALNQWLLLSFPKPEDDIEHDLRSGRLAYLLIRPVSYLGSVFVEAIGNFLVNLVTMGIVVFLFTWLVVGAIPLPVEVLPLLCVATFLAGCLNILFQMVIGVLAFWIHEIDPLTWFWEKMLFAAGGLILPLSMYPEWCQKIVSFTPFPYILGERSHWVFGFSWDQGFVLITHLLVWMGIAWMLLLVLYRRGMQIISVEGG